MLAGVVALLVAGYLDWRLRAVAASAVWVVFAVAVLILIAKDSAARGRSGGWWAGACIMLPPFALVAFVVLAVYDRLRGRRGIEARWAPAGRWYMLGSLVLAVAAAVLALSQVHVPGTSVSGPGGSASFSGSCLTALSVTLGTGTYGQSPEWATVAARCSAAASERMTTSAICLGGAMLLVLAGQGMNRRQGYRQRHQTLTEP
jgi:hypothetical protein